MPTQPGTIAFLNALSTTALQNYSKESYEASFVKAIEEDRLEDAAEFLGIMKFHLHELFLGTLEILPNKKRLRELVMELRTTYVEIFQNHMRRDPTKEESVYIARPVMTEALARELQLRIAEEGLVLPRRNHDGKQNP